VEITPQGVELLDGAHEGAAPLAESLVTDLAPGERELLVVSAASWPSASGLILS
jgi:hypothetical protein